MKSVKRILGLILVSMMLMTMILPASADSALDGVTRAALTMGVGGNDATFAGEKLNLNFPGVTFTSSDNAVINPATGVVTRPQQAKNVTLTATAGSETKDFAFRIPGFFDNAPIESVVYYDDFEDGVLDSRIETTDYTQATMEANGKLNFESTGTAGDLGTNSHSTGIINLKTDKTAVDGKFKVEFELKRDAFVYGRTRIYFSGPSGYAHYIDWMGSSTSDYVNWNTQIRLTTYGASNDDVLNAAAYKYVGTLKVEAVFDNSNNGSLEELIINGDKFNLNYCGQLATDRKVSKVSISEYHTNADILMNYFSCIQEKEASAEKVLYYDDFEDGVLSSHIERTDYSKFTNETMEANGSLNFKGNGTAAVTGRVWLKDDKTMTTGDVHMEFHVKRDFVYDNGFRVNFYGLDGSGNRVKAAEVDVTLGNVADWNTPLSIYTGTNAAVETETKYTIGSPNSYKFVVDVDGETGKMDLSINGTEIALNGGYLLSNFKGLACVGIMAMADTTDPWMEYFSCTQPVVKEAVTATSMDYNAFDKKVTIVSPVAKSATVIAASYSGTEADATLISAVPVPATLAEGGSVTVDTSALNISGASFIKLYLWDSTTGLKPLVASAYVSDVTAN